MKSGIGASSLFLLIAVSLSPALALFSVAAAPAAWGDSDFPYNDGPWPTLHHDAHNSDHTPSTIGSFTGLTDFPEIAWVLRKGAHPSVVLTVEALGSYADRDMFFIASGKTSESNLHAFDMADGAEIWRAASPATDNPGPGACAMSSMALLDENGRLFISDCQYVFRYTVNGAPDPDGVLPHDWRQPMPGLRHYDETDGLWRPADDPAQPNTRAKPFVTMFFTRKVGGKGYLGGISTEGGVYLFDPEDGSLYAEAYIDNTAAAETVDWTPDGPCDASDYAARDDPMHYDIAEGAEDGLTPFGIWCTGVRPETNDPDADYFMDPCQLNGYFNANTAGGGGMVINTPAAARDPDDPVVSRIYVNGSQSPFLAAFDVTPTAEDAFVYRIDFDPTAIRSKRLTVLNHQRSRADRFDYDGRMPNGENSLSSPTLSHDEKWIITADNQGALYNFSAENGERVWKEEIGSLLGSPTVVQKTEADGLFYIHTFGDSRLWTIACDPTTGAIVKKKAVDFRQYILRNHWRADDPGYGRHFVNQNGNAYERTAVGASIAVATDDKIVMAYTVGWHDPDRPAAFVIPSHSLILVVDRLSLLSDVPTAAMVDAGYIDVNGTMEQATLIAPSRNGLRALIAYGSQSTTFARFLEVNDKMPEGMKRLYVKPCGGVRIAAPVFAGSPALTPDAPTGQPAGGAIRWTAAFPGGVFADIRFSVGRAGEEMRILKDFSPVGVFTWTPLEEGDYTVQAAARNRETHADMGSVDAAFRIVSPVPAGATAAVTETSHPLVALFSHGSCPAGARAGVDFRPRGSGEAWARTGYARCVENGGANGYVAGLKGGVEYELRPVLVSQGVETHGEPLFHTTPDPGLAFPAIRVLAPADGSPAEQFVFMAAFPPSPSNPLPVASNLSGEVVWYYNRFREESVVATAPTPEGTHLLITADGEVQGQRLREVDPAGNIVREITMARINEQLAAMGQDEAGAFDHEAVRFPDGRTLVQVSVERSMPGVQPGVDDILGSMIIALDRDWQAAWAWNAFDHMDVNRAAVNGEKCLHTDDFTFPGCPPLFESDTAADWIHGNHIAPSPGDGHLIYSMRSQDWVVKIDYANGEGSGDVLWKLGKDGDFTALSDDPDPWFSHQHGAAYVSEHHMIVFDNGNTRCADGGDDCHSRGQMILLDETAKTATFQLNADMGVYSMALGNGQRLSDGGFSFTAGLLPNGATPKGQVIGVGPTGEKRFILEADMNIYRSYRMKNLYAPSWSGFTPCAAPISSDLTLKAPIIDIGGAYISADMAYDPAAGAPAFRLTGYDFLSDISAYSACDAAYLSLDGSEYSLFLPSASYGLNGYRVEMSPILGDAGELWFTVTEASEQ